MTEPGWIVEVRSTVDARLRCHFASKRLLARRLAPEAVVLIDALERLTLRGGKRLRPALLSAAFRAVAPERGSCEVLDACAALEMLQSYLLIHDDWMDQDETRRGGPTLHVALRGECEGDAHVGASLAILAGNLASAHAWELMGLGTHDEPCRRSAFDIFLRIHEEVVVGQHLDLVGRGDTSEVQRLKTGSYTVRGPLLLGAALAGSSPPQRAALEAVAEPLGQAFQIRDDLLGTFGDPAVTGKPVGGDLCAGRRTSLIRVAERRASASELQRIRSAVGCSVSERREIDDAKEALVSSGAKSELERSLAELVEEAHAALATAPLHAPGTTMLRDLGALLTFRDR